MNKLFKGMIGMGAMTDQVVATDFLISTKAGIRNIAFALTESANPEIRDVLRKELRNAVQMHETISNYMISKGFYHPHNIDEQFNMDLKITNTTLNLVQK